MPVSDHISHGLTDMEPWTRGAQSAHQLPALAAAASLRDLALSHSTEHTFGSQV